MTFLETAHEVEKAMKARIRALSRQRLEALAFSAWQYHQQANVLCGEHDLSIPDAECVCSWVNETRERANRVITEELS